MAARFYVYLLEDGDVPAYVGKGSGGRLAVQERRFALPGRVLERFDSEKAAYAAERKWIARLKPYHNRCAGGNGSRAMRLPNTPRWVSAIERMGTRVYAARILLACDRASLGIVDPSKIDAIRNVANGCRA